MLPRARAVISHGGAGTTLDALAAGTPTIAVPFFADQPRNAEQLVATGTGLAVPPGPDLTERLADALHAVLADEPPGCAAMAAAVHGLPDIGEAVALLERTRPTGARRLPGRLGGVGSALWRAPGSWPSPASPATRWSKATRTSWRSAPGPGD